MTQSDTPPPTDRELLEQALAAIREQQTQITALTEQVGQLRTALFGEKDRPGPIPAILGNTAAIYGRVAQLMIAAVAQEQGLPVPMTRNTLLETAYALHPDKVTALFEHNPDGFSDLFGAKNLALFARQGGAFIATSPEQMGPMASPTDVVAMTGAPSRTNDALLEALKALIEAGPRSAAI